MSGSRDTADSISQSDPSMPHHQICCCGLCMNSRIPAEDLRAHEAALKAILLDRKDPNKSSDVSLEKSVTAHAILTAGTRINMLTETGLTPSDLPSGYNIQLTEPQELTLKGQWKNKSQEPVKAGADANLFGKIGVFIIPRDIKVVNIPMMNALSVPKSFLEKYGAELIPLDQHFDLEPALHPSLENLYLVEYRYDKDYIEKYAMQLNGGGGIFIETHPFPQLFTPLSPDCSGPIILGVDKGKGEYDFAAFEIPFGFTFKIKANVIHGDSFFVGSYATALKSTDLADTVLLRQDTPNRDIQNVTYESVTPAKLPLLAEHTLAKKVNEQLLLNNLRHEGNKYRGFFEKLPLNTLIEFKNISPEAQHVFDKQFGLIPHNK